MEKHEVEEKSKMDKGCYVSEFDILGGGFKKLDLNATSFMNDPLYEIRFCTNIWND